MPDIASNVRSLCEAATALRQAAPVWPGALPPFSLVLFTDDRRQADLLSLLREVPEAGDVPPLAVLFRHDGLPAEARRALAAETMAVTKAKGHFFLTARMVLAGADGSHACPSTGFVSWPVHDAAEARIAEEKSADFGFVSPVWPTASHEDAQPLGAENAAALARRMSIPAFALGGMTADSACGLHGLPFYGMGVIGAWSG
ncbi:thiamine phosphate synthase [Parvularcula marina]|nr:thiamine phosphate synthase [Parvularcula marina]